MKHSVPHDLGQKRAKQATEAMIDSYRVKYAKYQPAGKWLSPSKAAISFKTAGMTIKGVIEVLPESIVVNFDVPFLFRPFTKQATQVVETDIKKWIAKAKKKED